MNLIKGIIACSICIAMIYFKIIDLKPAIIIIVTNIVIQFIAYKKSSKRLNRDNEVD